MKKSIFTLTLILSIILNSIAGNNSKIKLTDYVVTDEGITYVNKIQLGVDNSIIAKTETGEKIKFSKDDVNAYRKNGKEYKKFYKVNSGSNFVIRTFMQKMFSRAGYSLFRSGKDFYVYSGDKQELKINKENYKVVLSFFFPKFNMLYSK